MNRILLKSKIHRATVTQAELHYEGSVTIDHQLMKLADIIEYEQVQIYNVTNGNRLTTYAIEGAADSGIICINGAAAHLVRPGDVIIICSYAQFEESQYSGHQPQVVFVDGKNRPKARGAKSGVIE
ncbi:MAG: aspartate 1-decarboxylase [Planctomycetota bacterium]